MVLTVLFLLGVGNFVLHRAVLECGHPLVMQAPWLRLPHGIRISLGLEYLVLVGCMLMATAGSAGWAWGYGAYSLFNGFSGWLILSRRI